MSNRKTARAHSNTDKLITKILFTAADFLGDTASRYLKTSKTEVIIKMLTTKIFNLPPC
jgi:hypothetical protein